MRARTRRAGPGRPPKLVDPVRIEIVLEREMVEALNMLASDKQVPRNDLIRKAVTRYLHEPARKEGDH